MYRWIAVTVVLAGCGVSESKFHDEFSDAVCNKFEECAASADTDMEGMEGLEELFSTLCGSLVQTVLTEAEKSCDYDKSAAKDCLDAIEKTSCDSDPLNVKACEAVYGASCSVFDEDFSL